MLLMVFFLPDFYEELESFFDLSIKKFNFLNDEMYFKLNTKEFLIFLDNVDSNNKYITDRFFFSESLEILIF